jgi:hypothetical protein
MLLALLESFLCGSVLHDFIFELSIACSQFAGALGKMDVAFQHGMIPLRQLD